MFQHPPVSQLSADPVSDLLTAYGLRRTSAARLALGYQGMSMDFAVRGGCADCSVTAVAAAA